jgi:hypothetical protein
MPKTIIDYSKTQIYKIINYDCPELVYVGSTTNFTKRKQQHKTAVFNTNSPKYNIKLYVSIRDNSGWDNWKMIVICDYPCNNKRKAELEEDRHMMELKANMNMKRASRTMKQYYEDNKDKKKQYKEINKDKIKEQMKQYREDNKDKIKEYRENNKDKKKQWLEDNKNKIKEHTSKNARVNVDQHLHMEIKHTILKL